MWQKTLLAGVCGLLLLGLSGCYIPIVDKEVTIPFLEKKPEKAVKLMYQKMNSVDSMKYSGQMEFRFQLDPDKLELGDLTSIPSPFASKDDSSASPQVLGVSTTTGSSSSEVEAGDVPSSIDMSSPSSMDMDTPSAGMMSSLGGGILESLEDVSLTYQVEGKMDRTEENTNVSSDISLGVDWKNTTYNADMKVKSVDDSNYINIQGVPMPLSMIAGEFTEKWISFDSEEMAQKSDQDLSFLSDQEKMQEVQERLLKAMIKNDPLQVEKRLKDKEVDQHECYHYRVSMDKENMRSLISEGVSILQEESEQKEENSDEQKEKLDEFLNKMEPAITDMEAELWIDQDDLYLRKYNTQLDLDLSELSEEIPKESMKLTIKGKERMYGFGEEVNVTPPEDSTSFSDIIEEKMGGILSGQAAQKEITVSEDTSKEKSISTSSTSVTEESSSIPSIQTFSEQEGEDSDGDGIPDKVEENVFGTDPETADTDGDGYPDGEEVRKGYSPVGEGELDKERIKDNIEENY